MLPQLCLRIEDIAWHGGGSVENLMKGRKDGAEIEDLECLMYQQLTEPLSAEEIYKVSTSISLHHHT
jgi:hypothetical protein